MAVDAQELARLQAENVALRRGIPPELLAGVPADELEARAAALVAFRGQQPPAGAGTPIGVPVPAANASTAAEGEDARQIREWQHGVRWRAGRVGAMSMPAVTVGRTGTRARTKMDPEEAREAQWAFFTMSWNGHMDSRRTGRSNVSEPPRGAPAAAAIPAPARSF